MELNVNSLLGVGVVVPGDSCLSDQMELSSLDLPSQGQVRWYQFIPVQI